MARDSGVTHQICGGWARSLDLWLAGMSPVRADTRILASDEFWHRNSSANWEMRVAVSETRAFSGLIHNASVLSVGLGLMSEKIGKSAAQVLPEPVGEEIRAWGFSAKHSQARHWSGVGLPCTAMKAFNRTGVTGAETAFMPIF